MVKINVSTDLRITRDQLNQLTEKGKNVFANQVHMDMDQYVPMEWGDMRAQSHVGFDNEHIMYNAPYSIYQYSKQYRNYTTPGTGPYWDKVAARNHMPSWERVVERAMRL